jgi:hypothetical protein
LTRRLSAHFGSLLKPTLAAVLAASVVLALAFFLFVLPARPFRLDASAWRDVAARTVAGAYHVHSSRSDGAADKDRIAEAAARASLRFVIFTDHGDGTRSPDAAAYLHGVLCIDAVEISTDQGHYVALDMAAAPYPLGGAASAVVEDVARLGGFGIAAHPDSPKPALQWRDVAAPIDGIEWLSGDTEWRNETRRALTRAALGYVFRPGPALATLLDRPSTINRWDGMVRTRRVVALAAADAHGGVGRTEEDGRRRFVANVPSYEASFSAFSDRVLLETAWSGDAAADARALLKAIREGRVYTTIDAVAAPGFLEFHAETDSGRVEMGGALPAGTAARLVARVLAPPGAQVLIVDDSQPRRRGGLSVLGASRRFAPDGTQELHARLGAGQGAFRVEVNVPSAPGTPPIPWLLSNPIYFLPPRPPAADEVVAATGEAIDPAAWRIEKDPDSAGNLTPGPPAVLRYALTAGERRSQFVAVAARLAKKTFDGIRVRLRADRAMRVSVQLRRPDGERWRTSVYLDQMPRDLVIPVARFSHVDGRLEQPRPDDIDSLLLVIDLVNAVPGASGNLTIERVELLP